MTERARWLRQLDKPEGATQSLVVRHNIAPECSECGATDVRLDVGATSGSGEGVLLCDDCAEVARG